MLTNHITLQPHRRYFVTDFPFFLLFFLFCSLTTGWRNKLYCVGFQLQWPIRLPESLGAQQQKRDLRKLRMGRLSIVTIGRDMEYEIINRYPFIVEDSGHLVLQLTRRQAYVTLIATPNALIPSDLWPNYAWLQHQTDISRQNFADPGTLDLNTFHPHPALVTFWCWIHTSFDSIKWTNYNLKFVVYCYVYCLLYRKLWYKTCLCVYMYIVTLVFGFPVVSNYLLHLLSIHVVAESRLIIITSSIITSSWEAETQTQHWMLQKFFVVFLPIGCVKSPPPPGRINLNTLINVLTTAMTRVKYSITSRYLINWSKWNQSRLDHREAWTRVIVLESEERTATLVSARVWFPIFHSFIASPNFPWIDLWPLVYELIQSVVKHRRGQTGELRNGLNLDPLMMMMLLLRLQLMNN